MKKNSSLFEDNVKKPSAPHKVVNPNDIPTQAEIEEKERRKKKLKSLGIDIDVIDDGIESEDIDKLQARILIMDGKDIPKDLEEKLLKKKRKATHNQK